MSTRAVYTFGSGKEAVHIYKHHDGYPTGAAQWIVAALPFAWSLPRFEPDEFAAAFVAANKLYFMDDTYKVLFAKIAGAKPSKEFGSKKISVRVEVPTLYLGEENLGRWAGGGVRILASGDVHDIAPGDIAYRYEIDMACRELHIKAYRTNYWDNPKDELIFECGLDGMAAAAEAYEAAAKAEAERESAASQ